MSKKIISKRLIQNESDYKDPLEWGNLLGSFKFLFRSFIGSIISKKVKNKHKIKYLNLGSGSIYQDGWTNADFYRFRDIKIDWMLDAGKKWKCDDNFWDAIFSEHTLEHLTYKCAINALEESYRTLKKGGILRLSLPNINLSIEHLTGNYVSVEFEEFKTNAECISFVTQNWGHKSTWDPELMISLLEEIGFIDVKKMEYQQSTIQELCIETPDKVWESMYIEAKK
tara:strand:- start:128 stop:805 length:678 start_codon:yes stop_codon:yes gene_type:complete